MTRKLPVALQQWTMACIGHVLIWLMYWLVCRPWCWMVLNTLENKLCVVEFKNVKEKLIFSLGHLDCKSYHFGRQSSYALVGYQFVSKIKSHLLEVWKFQTRQQHWHSIRLTKSSFILKMVESHREAKKMNHWNTSSERPQNKIEWQVSFCGLYAQLFVNSQTLVSWDGRWVSDGLLLNWKPETSPGSFQKRIHEIILSCLHVALSWWWSHIDEDEE